MPGVSCLGRSVGLTPHFVDIRAAKVDEDPHLDGALGRVGGAVEQGIGHAGELEGDRPHVARRGVQRPHGVVVDTLVIAKEGLLEGPLDVGDGEVFLRDGSVELPVDGAVDGVVFLTPDKGQQTEGYEYP